MTHNPMTEPLDDARGELLVLAAYLEDCKRSDRRPALETAEWHKIIAALRAAPVPQCEAEPVVDRVNYPRMEPGPMIYLPVTGEPRQKTTAHPASCVCDRCEGRPLSRGRSAHAERAAPPSRLDAESARAAAVEECARRVESTGLRNPDNIARDLRALVTDEMVDAGARALWRSSTYQGYNDETLEREWLRMCGIWRNQVRQVLAAARVPPPSEAGSADVRAKLYELLRLFRDDYLSAGETISGILQDAAALVHPPSEAGREEPALAKMLRDVNPELADVLTDNAAYVRVIRKNVIAECAKVADGEALRCIRDKISGDSIAARIAKSIRALSPDPGTVAVASAELLSPGHAGTDAEMPADGYSHSSTDRATP